ncbi:MAG: transcriptional repressor [Alphaproteobacteria bacterium]|nr:transcriptional repressor [Alphaproteobacteria bacterium]
MSDTEIIDRLRLAGLRPTRQRLALATILFGSGDRHVSAESLHQEAVEARINVSLATVYNTLNQFKAAGMLREVAFEGDRTFFDTNTSNHFHYYLEDTGELVDIDTDDLKVIGLPPLPSGTQVDRIDVIVRLRKSASIP